MLTVCFSALLVTLGVTVGLGVPLLGVGLGWAAARVATRAGPDPNSHHWRRQSDEFPDDPGHRPLRSAPGSLALN